MRIFLGFRFRPWATGVYFERALAKKHEVSYIGPGYAKRHGYPENLDLPELIRGKLSPPDLVLIVDPGGGFFPRGLEKMDCPTAIYLVDVHLDFTYRAAMAPFFDYVFVAQKDYVARFQELGNRQVSWLPLGCDPEIHGKREVEKTWEVGFVGQVFDAARARRLKLLSERYQVNDTQKRYSKEEITEVYSRSKIVFNSSINGDLNMRVFEGLASGSLVVTDRIENGQRDLFQSGVHLVEYGSDSELLEAVEYYLGYEEERERIARAGYGLAIKQHTYARRCTTILETIFDGAGPKKMASAREMRPADVIRARADIYRRHLMVEALMAELKAARTSRGDSLQVLKWLAFAFTKRIYRKIRYPNKRSVT